MDEKEPAPPALFEGATHRLAADGTPVKCVQWKKDGDHPLVDRYPIERREFKGMLVVSPKEKFGLRFGEWIIEDAAGRLWIEPSQELPAKYIDIAEAA
jgi:hypothetical protein